jgi:hypothetical protein
VCSLLPGNMLGAALGQQEEDLNRWMVDNGFAVAYRWGCCNYAGQEGCRPMPDVLAVALYPASAPKVSCVVQG